MKSIVKCDTDRFIHHAYIFCDDTIKQRENPEIIQQIVEEYFSSDIKKFREKKIKIGCFSYIMLHVMNVIYKAHNDIKNWSYLFDINFDDIESFDKDVEVNQKNNRVLIKFSATCDKSHKEYYHFLDQRICHCTLINTLKLLEKKNLVRHYSGYNIKNNDPVYDRVKFGCWIFNYKKLYEEMFKTNLKKFIKLFRNTSKNDQEYVKVRVKKEVKSYTKSGRVKIDTEGVDIDYEKYDNIRNAKIIKRSIPFMKKLSKFYQNYDVKFLYFEELEKEQQNFVLNTYKNRYKKEFNVEVFNNNVSILNFCNKLKSDITLHRIFHLTDQNKLTNSTKKSRVNLIFGRMYGSFIDNMSAAMKPCIVLDDKSVGEIDIKSCIPQLFVLKKCSKVDNKQDFYQYSDELFKKYDLDRQKMKQLTQCFMNCTDLNQVRAAFASQMRSNNEVNNLNKTKKIEELYNDMLSEKQFFSDLFLHPEMYSYLVYVESEYMLKVCRRLYNEKIPFLYHFDAIIVDKEKIDYVYSIMQDVAVKIFRREIKLSTDTFEE